MKKSKRTKKQNQSIHAKNRALDRYNVMLDTKDLIAIVDLIRDGKAKMLYKTSNSKSVQQVEYQGQNFVVAYDKRRKSIASFLPKDAKELIAMETKEVEEAIQKQQEEEKLKQTVFDPTALTLFQAYNKLSDLFNEIKKNTIDQMKPDANGQLVINTGIYKWKDGSFHTVIETINQGEANEIQEEYDNQKQG